MTRGWKFFFLGVLAAVLAVPANMGLTWLSFSDLDKAVWREARHQYRDVSDIVAKHLPNDFQSAARELRAYGYVEGRQVEGRRYVGEIYGRRPAPVENATDSREVRMKRTFNRVLDQHDAEWVRYFERKIPSLNPVDTMLSMYARIFAPNPTKLFVYLLLTTDGVFKIYAKTFYLEKIYYI